jgi:SulP family sulfate permease
MALTESAAARASSRVRALLPRGADFAITRRSWRMDLVAGVTVGIVALPLALAFGVSSGAGAEAGLVTAIVAGVVAAVFGGSHVQVSGPTGAMVVVLAPIIAIHGVGVLGIVGLLAGLLVLAAGVLRLGRTVSAIPWPVIEGFTAGIAVIIFLQQVPAAFGQPSTGHGTNAAVAALEAIARASGPTTWWSLGLVALVAAVSLALAPLGPRVPGAIIAVGLATAVAVWADAPVAVIGELPAGLPAPSLPSVEWSVLGSLMGPILTVAALAAIESLLSARMVATHSDTGPYDPDRELVGQGLASVASAAFGGMPATGAIARTAVNVRAGGRSRLSAITHAVLLLLVIGIGGALVARIPLAALAGVLMVTAMRMVPIRTVRAVVRSSRQDAVVFWVTAIVTVSVDLVYAVAIGVVAAAFFALRTLAQSAGVHREELPGPATAHDDSIALFRIDGALFFGAAERVVERLAAIDGVSVVILRMSQVHLLDATGAQVLAELVTSLERRGITVLVKGIQPRHMELAERAGILASLSHEHHVFDILEPAVAHAREHAEHGSQH